MKKRLVKYVTGACVAGLVAGMPAIASAAPGGAEGSETAAWSASENMNRALYGPPEMFDPREEPVQVLYGPPEVFQRAQNPMKVKVANKVAKESKLAAAKKSFSKAIVVRDAAGTVRYAKVDDGSSKRLSVNKKTGAVTVRKGTKKGVYRIIVKVTAKGDTFYRPAEKLVTVKVRVK